MLLLQVGVVGRYLVWRQHAMWLEYNAVQCNMVQHFATSDRSAVPGSGYFFVQAAAFAFAADQHRLLGVG